MDKVTQAERKLAGLCPECGELYDSGVYIVSCKTCQSKYAKEYDELRAILVEEYGEWRSDS